MQSFGVSATINLFYAYLGIPDWLGGSSATSAKPDAGYIKKTEEQVKEVISEVPNGTLKKEETEKIISNITEKSHDSDESLVLKQQQLNLDLQNTYASLQQQETFLLISLQLKKYEENLESIKHQQREILEKQEKRFDTVLEKYAIRQQIIENNIRQQQEMLNKHVQLLILHPPSDISKEHISGNETIKTLYHDAKDMENIIHSLKQKHNEEIFLMEESYK